LTSGEKLSEPDQAAILAVARRATARYRSEPNPAQEIGQAAERIEA
jgi:hypothetical protein